MEAQIRQIRSMANAGFNQIEGKPVKALEFRLSKARALVCCVAALVVVACGGGGSSSDPKIQAADQSAARARAQAVQAQAAIQPISPASPQWNRETACTRESGDFLAITSDMDTRAGLLSRHVSCITLVSDPQTIVARVMRTPDQTGWQLWQPGSSEPAQWDEIGTAVFETRYQTYGPATQLNKLHSISMDMVSFTRREGFLVPGASVTTKVKPLIKCEPFNINPGVNDIRCTGAQVDAFEFTLPTRSSTARIQGSGGVSRDFTTTFNWTNDASQGYPDLLYFKVELDGADYFNQNDDPSAPDWMPYSRLTLDSSAGQQYAPQIRCDRNVVRDRSQGCVLPEAAAVMVTDSANPDVAEAAQHIRDAQTQLQPGMTELAPGVYQALEGARAVARTGQSESQYQPLLYLGTDADGVAANNANRNAACKLESSLFKTRPYNGSASCPARDTAECQCDEYPYAATFNGAANYPGSTSVRSVNGVNNERQGIELGNFILKQRIIPTGLPGADGFYVFVK